MTRPTLAADPAEALLAPRRSARVATVAADLDMHPSEIRKMIAAGELESHGKGVRGIRVYLDSVARWQERRDRPVTPQKGRIAHKNRPAAASTAAYRAALAGLQAKGLA
jgi:hypothetical protein